MTYKLYINDHEGIDEPTAADIYAWMEALNSAYPHTFYVELDAGTIAISHVNAERVQFAFSSYQGKNHWLRGWLTDPAYTQADGEIEYLIGEQVNTAPLYLTVPRETAAEVATYYLEYEALPDGLTWQGRMG